MQLIPKLARSSVHATMCLVVCADRAQEKLEAKQKQENAQRQQVNVDCCLGAPPPPLLSTWRREDHGNARPNCVTVECFKGVLLS